jgi:hypothetical protein
MTPEAARGSSYGFRVPEALSQPFLDAAALRLRKATRRGVRVRAWIGSGLVHLDGWPEPGRESVPQSPPLLEPWEAEPPEVDFAWIEVRSGRMPWRERHAQGTSLETADATGVLESFLLAVQDFMPDRVRPCEARVEIGSREIRWWYERDGRPVLELEPLPLDLLPDDPEDGEGGSGVREPRRPSPEAPSAADAIDPAA